MKTSNFHRQTHLEDAARAVAGGAEQYLAGFARDITDSVAAERHRGLLESKLLDAQKLESLGILLRWHRA